MISARASPILFVDEHEMFFIVLPGYTTVRALLSYIQERKMLVNV